VDVVVVEANKSIIIEQEVQNTVTVTSQAQTVVVTAGLRGAQGATGSTGPTGIGVPNGGLENMRLVKKSDADYDTEWAFLTPMPAGNDKELQFNDGGVMGGDVALRWDKNNETLKLGTVGTELFPDAPIVATSAVDSYSQVIIHNTSPGTSASGDFVVTADDGTDELEYIDLGMSSSAFDDPVFECTKAHDGYLLNVSSADLVIAAAGNEDGKTRFYAGGLLDTDHVLDITKDGITLEAGKTISNRPPIYFGTGSPPSATGLPDGALFLKYTP
jgi:hypothetical protein